MASILADIEKHIKPCTTIPKTASATSGCYIVIEVWSRRKSRGEDALVYSIPTKKPGRKPNRKQIVKSDWVKAAKRLTIAGEFTCEWFKQCMPVCHNDGYCNFTSIGGIFQRLNYAIYERQGVYRKLPSYDGEDGDGLTPSEVA
jgi:hypothetical protein